MDTKKWKSNYLVFLVLGILLYFFPSCIGHRSLVSPKTAGADYDLQGDAHDGWMLIHKDSLWGYRAADGKSVIPTQFSWADAFSDGLALVQDSTGYRYINANGRFVGSIHAKHAFSFREGLAAVEKNGKFGFINPKGRFVIKNRYDWAESFHGGRAAVSIGVYKGYIDKNGEMLIPAIYQEAGPFKAGVAVIRKDFKYGMIDTLGNLVLDNVYDEIIPWGEGYYRLGVIKEETGLLNTFGLADSNGTLLLDTLYTDVALRETEYAPREAERFSYKDITLEAGETYSSVTPVHYGERQDLALAYKNNKVGLIDRNMKVVLPIDYLSVNSFFQGRVAVHKSDHWGYLDERFRLRIPFQYHQANNFEDGLAVVERNRKKGAISRNGQILIPLRYNSLLTDFRCDRIYAQTPDSTFIYNHSGQLLFSADYTFVGMYGGEDFVPFRQHGKLGIMDFDFQVISAPQFDRIGHFYDGMAWVVVDGKGGYINRAFRWVVPAELSNIEDFACGIAKVEKGALSYYIDTQGLPVQPSSEQIRKHEEELERRAAAWIDFSS